MGRKKGKGRRGKGGRGKERGGKRRTSVVGGAKGRYIPSHLTSPLQRLSRKSSVAGPIAEEIAAVTATTHYISTEGAKGKSKKKNFMSRSARFPSETALEETSSRDSMIKYLKVKDVSELHVLSRGGMTCVTLLLTQQSFSPFIFYGKLEPEYGPVG